MTVEKYNYSAIIAGLQGQGKSHRAMHRAIVAASGATDPTIAFPGGVRCRVFVQDPSGSFERIARTFASPSEWASAARAAAERKEPVHAIARFLTVDPQLLVDTAIASSKASGHRIPSLVIFDEGLLLEAASDNYIAPWLKEANAIRRHLGIGWIFCVQNASIHQSLIDSATELDIFRVVNAKQVRRLGELANIPEPILDSIPTLKPRQFHTGSPSSPESWR